MHESPQHATHHHRIGIVDDHAIVISGVSAELARHHDLELVGQASTVGGLLALARRCDLVLLDLRLGDGSTPTANIDRLERQGVPVLVYSSGDDLKLVREAARAGTVGFVRKSEPLSSLIAAIRHALGGGVVASFEWALAIDSDPQLSASQLTPREREVLSRYASGETAESVAAALSISPHTVLDHIKRIRNRYAREGRPAPTKSHLLQRAIEDGLVNSD